MSLRFPPQLRSFQMQAEKFIRDRRISDIEFSGNTYQVAVQDDHYPETVWAFIQLDALENIKDSFCSCNEQSQENCVHIAAAYLAIFKQSEPLHVRFVSSLWNILCQAYAKKKGLVKKNRQKDEYRLKNKEGQFQFFIKAKTATAINHLSQIFERTSRPTEEYSIKFANLSPEDLAQWLEGKPSQQLAYELSSWNDLAHWLIFLEDWDPFYNIDFQVSIEKVPIFINIEFAEITLGFALTKDLLREIIPSLANVNSPLRPIYPQKKILKAHYQNDILTIEREDLDRFEKEFLKTEKIDLGDWWLVPHEGFYPKHATKMPTVSKLKGAEIGEFLNQSAADIKDIITGAEIHLEPIQLSYSLHFDAQWNLHIDEYALSSGDIAKPTSKRFGNWLYLENKGFFRLVATYSTEIQKVIPFDELSDFIRLEKAWLNEQEGFHVNLKNIDTQIGYELSEKGLSFKRLVAQNPEYQGGKDFGAWIYVPQQGFYAKSGLNYTFPFNLDTTVPPFQIPLFIRMFRNELKLIPHFFNHVNPIADAKLFLGLTPNGSVTIQPHYLVDENYQNKELKFFDEFVYVKGEGFYELPLRLRLPEQYLQPVTLPPTHLTDFLLYELPALGTIVEVKDERLKRPQQWYLNATEIFPANDKGPGIYGFKLFYKTEIGKVPVTSISTAFASKQRFLLSPAGCIDLKHERFNWLRVLPKERVDAKKEIVYLNTLEIFRLEALQGIHVDTGQEAAKEAAAHLKDLISLASNKLPILAGMRLPLRHYQELGLHWLWKLYLYGLSGLLCDDMGLGKTHQAMALFNSILQEAVLNGSQRPKFLILCPTSVIFHWQDKLAACVPQLKVCVFHGTERSLNLEPFDVLLTSYGIWRGETERLSKLKFDVAIFDEIQIAKNKNSLTHISLRHVHAKMRLGLTGTPIENRLRELKALFDIVLPTYMPGETEYRDWFVKPIERGGNQERKMLLSKLIKPFVLRRKKEEVLPDLPEKTEEISHCYLSPEQQALYTEVLHRTRSQLLEQLRDPHANVPYVHIFSVLSSLKQICNHPAAYLKQPEKYAEYNSGKWELFVELLNEARESGQKVVVFSQYLAMLDILEIYLNDISVDFASVRGSTLNRADQINRFNRDPQCEVFLGSLQAVGLGVDLTAGSVVIHYDRWWNAARENQATDRVHRIGQTRGVQVFKLVTKGTFEERIDYLITEKARLLEEVVSTDDHRFMKQFNREELMQLLQDVSEIK